MKSESNPAIDLHAHAIFAESEAIARSDSGWARANQIAAIAAGRASVEYNSSLMATAYRAKFANLDERLRAMDAMGMDIQAVSPAPLYNYWADRELAARIVASANQGMAALCARRPDRLVGLGTLSMQHPDLAVEQLVRAVRMLGLKGAIVSTSVNDRELADPAYDPLWRTAEELGALIFMHPAGCAIGTRLSAYYLSNLIGNPADTTIAIAHLIFAGVLDRFPRLKLCAAHGGGYFPFYVSRFDHGWAVRPEAQTCREAPSRYLRRIWFDSLVYSPEQLELLVRRAGAGQVVIGTDYPFDMGVEDPLERLNAASGLDAEERIAIRGENATRLLKLNTQ
ncbi:MAG TPA: amidohydrolase family protein [Candidatus Binataceae bacterium]|nr:amidohydrolase family protein [Candidatus Binataceae bacterium]